ncbi:hypothetical protein LZ554_002932 [Drepanopeziza brunnea f. sp. 'monogermtubi']|nr:hypothetical protein LZ554_002932 [Drepanopeziza brunnea f. sp. 'monogermtubi']
MWSLVVLSQRSTDTTPSLSNLALQKDLWDASPIFGHYSTTSPEPQDQPAASTWMSSYLDTTLLVHMNLPGTRRPSSRCSYGVTNSSLVFWYGRALQSQTATVENVLFGFYRWLDEHPPEAVLLSLNFGAATALGTLAGCDGLRPPRHTSLHVGASGG